MRYLNSEYLKLKASYASLFFILILRLKNKKKMSDIYFAIFCINSWQMDRKYVHCIKNYVSRIIIGAVQTIV